MDQPIPLRAKLFVAVTAAIGAWLLGTALLHWHARDLVQFGCYFAIAILASTLKIRLPGMESTMSVHFLFVLLGTLELSLAETLAIGCAAALVQSLWRTTRRPEALKVVFNVLSMSATAICLTYVIYHSLAEVLGDRKSLLLLVAATTYFLSNTVPVALVIALSEKQSMRKIWVETYFWSFPYYLAGAAVVGFVSYLAAMWGWETGFLSLPIMYGIYRSYHLYVARLDNEKERVKLETQQVEIQKGHVGEVYALHMRTIEALVLAIDAKDHTTYLHLNRVRTYVEKIGEELGLDNQQLDALRAAALLHDIGKLAVPDHIIGKPGRLTPEEFEKVKIHPIIGASILEKIAFPYPVVPIVRSHHESWDGTGYPDGLKGEEIPIGARILSAVDFLDALISDRPYRTAMPLDEAMKMVADQAGKAFDPKVVEILQHRYRELEMDSVRSLEKARLDSRSLSCNVQRGEMPGAGFEIGFGRQMGSQSDFLSSIASARQEAHTLFELCQDLGNSLSLDESLSLVAMRLRKLVPYDSIVAFTRKGDFLMPEFVNGDNYRLLSSLAVPMGKGLCGWVAQNETHIMNGNPAVEEGFALDPKKNVELRSALAVPLEGIGGLVGVLTLYQIEADAFTADHLRVLQVITSKLARFIENALKYRQAEILAVNDYLTGLPNARGLSIRLEQELERCKREHSTFAIMVCDLNGFKQINDRYGHMAGDGVLKRVAKLMQEMCRQYDYVARMGGDEFVIIAPGITRGAAIEKAIQLSALAQEAGRDVCGEDALSMSIGAAFYPQDGPDAAKLLAEADRKAYEAKLVHYQCRDPRSILAPAV
jgi:diguanylate cyclase (GGDEF)-like protein/putative nucleotidyltransferase with HDIG domain